jgi:cytochrome d ubiquinol oxidase subunit I
MAGACILIAAQVFVGDHVGGVLAKYQPAKLQAAEGWWDLQTPSPTPYLWVIVPDQAAQRNRFQMGTPYFGSIWLTKSLKGTIGGLRNTPVDQQPRMVLVFYSFKLMLALGMTLGHLAVAAMARPPLFRALVPACFRGDDADGCRGDARRLVHGRDRPAAVRDRWNDAHR